MRRLWWVKVRRGNSFTAYRIKAASMEAAVMYVLLEFDRGDIVDVRSEAKHDCRRGVPEQGV